MNTFDYYYESDADSLIWGVSSTGIKAKGPDDITFLSSQTERIPHAYFFSDFYYNNIVGIPKYKYSAGKTERSQGEVEASSEYIAYLASFPSLYLTLSGSSVAAVYQDMATVPYSFGGNEQKIEVLCSFTDVAGGSIRLYDVTNSNVLCEKTGMTNTDKQFIDMGTLSDLPTSEAIIEVQGKKNGAATVNLFGIRIKAGI